MFLLRQYFMTIPREMDEAAMIDGAGPFRILRSVIVPQSIPAITAVTLFHFFWAWNDFFVPLLYLANKPELQPLSIGIQQYNALYASQPTLIQASAVLAMAVPVVIFFLAQRAFMRGVVVTGRGQVGSAGRPSAVNRDHRTRTEEIPGALRPLRRRAARVRHHPPGHAAAVDQLPGQRGLLRAPLQHRRRVLVLP